MSIPFSWSGSPQIYILIYLNNCSKYTTIIQENVAYFVYYVIIYIVLCLQGLLENNIFI